MNLIVDVGNSFVKVAVFQADEILFKETINKSDSEKKIGEVLKRYPQIDGKIVSSVSGASFSLPKNLHNKADTIVLDSSTKLPFVNLYATPETLGNDRKALVAAASKYYEKDNVLIIDAGTCLTFDFKNQKNEYLGGAISPGLEMRFKALNAFTARLPLQQATDDMELIGNSTKSSINSGVVHGMCKELEGVIADYRSRFEQTKIIFTGGDAQFLSKRLKNGIFANSNFLLEGLNYILEFNKSQ